MKTYLPTTLIWQIMAFLNWPIKTYCFENLVIGDVACTTLRHTTMFTYSHANTPLGQSERTYYLSYFIILFRVRNCNKIFLPKLICQKKSIAKLIQGTLFKSSNKKKKYIYIYSYCILLTQHEKLKNTRLYEHWSIKTGPFPCIFQISAL